MERIELDRLMRALIGTVERTDHAQAVSAPLIAISRSHAAGGEEIARMLAEALRIPCYDREILEAIVKEAKVNPVFMESLDEKVTGRINDLLKTVFFGSEVGPEDYYRHLIKVLAGIALQGGVIVGRGSHLALAGQPGLLRVRITGSPRRCAERLAARKGISIEEALNEVEQVDRDRAGFIKRLYDADINDPFGFDMMLNTDQIDLRQAANAILFLIGEMLGSRARMVA